MKTTCKIVAFQDRLGQTCFEALRRLYAEGIKNTVFEIELPPSHPLIPDVVALLKSHGLKMRPSVWVPARSEYIDITYCREFEEEDYTQAEWLQVRADETAAIFYGHTPEGNLRFGTDYLKPNFRVGSVIEHIVVNDSVREAITRQGFKRLQVRECVITGPGAENWADLPIWQTTSDLVLPPLSPECKLCDGYGGQEITNPDKGCTIDEGLYLPVQLRYKARDLRKLDPWDIGLTREAFGFKLESHPLVVSQRFYQFCKKQRFKMFWYPVRIDPD